MSDTSDDKANHLSATPKAKRPYNAPTLRAWGTLRDITLAVGVSGVTDGGKSKSANKTH